MRKLTKFERRMLSYFDKKLSDKPKKDILNILKNEMGLDQNESNKLYVLWHYHGNSENYENLEIEEDNELVNFIMTISSFSKDQISQYIDDLWDNDHDYLTKIYGTWFNVGCDYSRQTPCINWTNEGMLIELDREDWANYFSGLDEDDQWKYYDATSSYSDYYEEVYEDEMEYVHYNDETIDKLETIAVMAGTNKWPGKDDSDIEHGEISNFLKQYLPPDSYSNIVDNYIGEVSIQLTKSRQKNLLSTYEEEIKFPPEDYCQAGGYCLFIPYWELLNIIKEKNITFLSELRDAEINDKIDLSDSYYDNYLDDEGIKECVYELNSSIDRVIDKIVDDGEIDIPTLIKERGDFYQLIQSLGFELISSGSNKGDWYRSKDDKIHFFVNDVDFKNKKIKFTYEGKGHIVPIDNLSDWVQGSVLDLNESVKMKKKLLKEEKENITKISIFDFDGTLMDTPTPEYGIQYWEEFTGEKYPHKGWWSKPESLDDSVFNIEPIGSTIVDYYEEMKNPNTLVIMLTGRLPHQSEQIEELLSTYEISFDEYHYKNDGDTLSSKINSIKSLLRRYPNVTSIEMWEDREPHAIEFEKWGKENGVPVKVNLVISNDSNFLNESFESPKYKSIAFSKIKKPPYIYELNELGFNMDDMESFFSKLFGIKMYITDDSYFLGNDVMPPNEYDVMDGYGNIWYNETNDQQWAIRRFDDWNNEIYYEDSDGIIIK